MLSARLVLQRRAIRSGASTQGRTARGHACHAALRSLGDRPLSSFRISRLRATQRNWPLQPVCPLRRIRCFRQAACAGRPFLCRWRFAAREACHAGIPHPSRRMLPAALPCSRPLFQHSQAPPLGVGSREFPSFGNFFPYGFMHRLLGIVNARKGRAHFQLREEGPHGNGNGNGSGREA